jgi:hypothetical protein
VVVSPHSQRILAFLELSSVDVSASPASASCDTYEDMLFGKV